VLLAAAAASSRLAQNKHVVKAAEKMGIGADGGFPCTPAVCIM
jgi:hypothetical protein